MSDKKRNFIEFLDHLRANAAEGETRRLVIFHHADMDGAFAGASVMMGGTECHRLEGLKTELFVEPVNYVGYTEEEILALVTPNSDVFVVDFAFPLELSRKIAEKASFFVTIDHHKTSAEQMSGEPWAIFDMTSSGALMAWQYFQLGGTVPLAITLADNRDLWKKTEGREDQFHEVGMLVRSEVYAAMERGNARNIEYLNRLTKFLANDDWTAHQIRIWGDPVIAKRDANIAYIASSGNIIESTIGGHPAVLVNYGVDQSDVCEYLYKKDEYKDKIIAAFSFKHGGVNFSLRKNKDLDLDLGQIAGLYGGGGHSAAAGFVVDLNRGFGIIANKEKWAMVSDSKAVDEVMSAAAGQVGDVTDLLKLPVKMASRLVCETDKSVLQWLPYLILRNEKREIFTYQRPVGGGESRLYGDLSIGLGGHVDSLPDVGQTLANHLATEALRELVEEVGMDVEGDRGVALLAMIEGKITNGDFGVLRIHDGDVGEYHMGLAIILDVESTWLTKLEAGEVERARWVRSTELLDLPMKTGLSFEQWSYIVATQTSL